MGRIHDMVGEFPSPGLTVGRTDRRLAQLCIVSGCVGEEESLSSGEETRIKAFLTRWKHQQLDPKDGPAAF